MITVGLFGATTAQAQEATPSPVPPIVADSVNVAQSVPALPMPVEASHLSKKTKEIAALRDLYQHRFSGADARAVLPILRSLLATQKSVEANSEKALETERNALLSIEPGEPLPVESSAQLFVEIQRLQQATEKAWYDVQKSVGEDKANTLARLVGKFRGFGGRVGNRLSDAWANPPVPSIALPAQGGTKPVPLKPGQALPTSPTPEGTSEATPVIPGSSTPSGTLEESVVPTTVSQAGISDSAPVQVPAPVPSQKAQPDANALEAPVKAQRNNPTTPAYGRGLSRTLRGQRAFPGMPPGVVAGDGWVWGNSLSLRELVELLEAKANASKSR